MSAYRKDSPGERSERGSGLVRRGEGSKKGCAVGAVGTLRRKMDSIFHEHRSKHRLREGERSRGGGEGSRAQVEKQYRSLPTNFTNRWRAKRRASFCWL